MNNTQPRFRQNDYSLEREHRLCFQHAPGSDPRNPVARGVDAAGDYAAENLLNPTWKFLAETLGTTVDKAAQIVAGIPVNFVKGIAESWDKSWSKQTLVDLLHGAKNMFFDAPVLRDIFERKLLDKVKVETLQNLTNSAMWIAAFQKPGMLLLPQLLDSAQTPPGPEPYGPDTFLLSLPKEDRVALFMEFVDKYVPEDVQRRLNLIPGSKLTMSPMDRVNRMGAGEVMNAAQALSLILGVEDMKATVPDPLNPGATKPKFSNAQKTIAEESLRKHYEKIRKDLLDPRSPMVEGLHLLNDYRDALEYHRLSELPIVQRSPDELLKKLPPGMLRGALQMGIVDRNRLENLNPLLQGLETQRSRTVGATAQKLEELRGPFRREAINISTTMKNLSGFEWIAFGILAWVALRNKFLRGVVVAGIGTYFVRRIAMNDKNPMGTFSAWLNKGMDMFGSASGTTAGEAGEIATGSPRPILRRTEAIVSLLPPQSQIDSQVQATSLSLLVDVPMRTLATAFVVKGTNGDEWTFSFTDSLATDIRTSMRKYGLDADPKLTAQPVGSGGQMVNVPVDPLNPTKNYIVGNNRKVTEGVGFMFYTVARNEIYKSNDKTAIAQVEIVEKAKLPVGSSIVDLTRIAKQDRRYAEAARAYVHLVNEGKRMATSGGLGDVCLGDYVIKASNKKNDEVAKKRDEEEKELQRNKENVAKVKTRKEQLDTFNREKWDAVLMPPDKVKFWQTVEAGGATVTTPIEGMTTLAKFLAMNNDDISKKYNVWTRKNAAHRLAHPDPLE